MPADVAITLGKIGAVDLLGSKSLIFTIGRQACRGITTKFIVGLVESLKSWTPPII